MNHCSRKKRLEIVQPEKQKNKKESCKNTLLSQVGSFMNWGKKRQVWVPLFHGNKIKDKTLQQQQLQSKNPRTVVTTATKMTPGTRDFEKKKLEEKKKGGEGGDRN
jgi:D-alanine-D-alanine ligase-like ATP-grasp enzyme